MWWERVAIGGKVARVFEFKRAVGEIAVSLTGDWSTLSL